TGVDAHTIWSAPSTPTYYRTEYISGAGSPVWNPSGTTVAVSEQTLDPALSDKDCQIWVIPASGRGAHALSADAGKILSCEPSTVDGQSLTWSPNGKTLAYATRQGLMTVPASGGTPRVLQSTKGIASVAWAPDGSTILAEVFADVSARSTSVNQNQGAIESFPTSGGPPTVLIPPSAQVSFYSPGLAWSPDGKRFAFAGIQPGALPGAKGYRIVTAAANGTDLRILARPAYSNAISLTGWSRTPPGSTGLGSGATPTTQPPPTPPPTPPRTVPPVQAPTAGPVPAVSGTQDLTKQPTIAPGGTNPPTTLTGKDLIVGTGPEATINSTVTFRSITTNYETGQPVLGSDWATVSNPPSKVEDEGPGYRDAVVGMRVGGLREVVIPPSLGYGQSDDVFLVYLLSTT
ncbi:MAG: FKBP-type peptidyl-prolyl cis-trans isomerase, partial [Actinomycetota bacterium]|nr:FKBP-type peptidyl-prolyl cis-trans isomerase [Actinomycetota bacterium]